MINNSTDLSGRLALDVNDLASLKTAAKQNSPEALKTAAKQFEALFMNMIMKSMRDASPQDGMMDNQQTKMYTTMLDQQISQKLAERGVGLADVLIRQLSNNKGVTAPASSKDQPVVPTSGVVPGAVPGTSADKSGAAGKLNPLRLAQIAAFQAQLAQQNEDTSQVTGISSQFMFGQATLDSALAAGATATTAPTTTTVASTTSGGSRAPHVKAFEDMLSADAAEASRTTGIPAKFMLGQAALESGWGKHQIKAADGSPSHNLFGIKATGDWKGKVVSAATTEYVNGVAQTKIEKFRAYDSYADGFKDYAKLLSKNPRYENVIANARDATSFAQGLQRAGYATDPNYAAKLTRIIKQSLSA